ncbi:hypothetical protein NDU88_013102 [Pleurodeles waltl]|uniref:Major histocompatibility complex class I-related gene protein-like n=1 Tax=Pleurodeles waltl TaxID=8319 RepID=A0AAV7R3R8_PLEWA|nr:hypothetical protein NDU88_013102 [Pleurodeles waltl]
MSLSRASYCVAITTDSEFIGSDKYRSLLVLRDVRLEGAGVRPPTSGTARGAFPALVLLVLGGLVPWLPAAAGSQSYRIYCSYLSERIPRTPQFSMVAYVGDVPIEGYNSETKRLEPKVTWMEKKHRLYWLWEGEGLQLMESALTEEVKAMMRRMNHTAGLHTLQKMYGCELGENGRRTWFYHEAYDGENLLSLNGDSVTYKADTHPATIILERWIAKKIMIQQLKDYLENPCLSHLQRYLKDGAESLQRVTPRIMSCRMKNGAHTYYCGNVYGFHPREIEVKWFRDGLEIHTDFMEILPNPDGTFQLRMTVEVQEGDMKTYRGQVYIEKEYLLHHCRGLWWAAAAASGDLRLHRPSEQLSRRWRGPALSDGHQLTLESASVLADHVPTARGVHLKHSDCCI